MIHQIRWWSTAHFIEDVLNAYLDHHSDSSNSK